MEDLSLHILDIAQNSFRANAKLLKLVLKEDVPNNKFYIEFYDDGDGMSKENLERVLDPFYTTRTTREVGMGLSLFKMGCEQCEGDLTIDSTEGVGTVVKAYMDYDSINRLPLGDIASTVYFMMINDYGTEVDYVHLINEKEFRLSTLDLKEILDGVSLKEIDVMKWIKSNINESLKEMRES
jgi:hypothetical protein